MCIFYHDNCKRDVCAFGEPINHYSEKLIGIINRTIILENRNVWNSKTPLKESFVYISCCNYVAGWFLFFLVIYIMRNAQFFVKWSQTFFIVLSFMNYRIVGGEYAFSLGETHHTPLVFLGRSGTVLELVSAGSKKLAHSTNLRACGQEIVYSWSDILLI